MKILLHIVLLVVLFEAPTKASAFALLFFSISNELTEKKTENNLDFSEKDTKGEVEEKYESEIHQMYLNKKTLRVYPVNFEFNRLKNSFFYQKTISEPYVGRIVQPPEFI